DPRGQVRPPGGQVRAASLAELARHRPVEIAAGKRLGRPAHVTEPIGRHQHEDVRRDAADILAFETMALRLESRLAVGHVTHLSTITSALEPHGFPPYQAVEKVSGQ